MRILIIVEYGIVADVLTSPGDNTIVMVDKDVERVVVLGHDPVHPDSFDSYVKSVACDQDGRPYTSI